MCSVSRTSWILLDQTLFTSVICLLYWPTTALSLVRLGLKGSLLFFLVRQKYDAEDDYHQMCLFDVHFSCYITLMKLYSSRFYQFVAFLVLLHNIEELWNRKKSQPHGESTEPGYASITNIRTQFSFIGS